ncbi:hypothetical protein TanjilG_30201 [Lupinus angustifolius]|uniref:Senescence regulator n=1 Tax=Lupinus angustifolius TaxID=3871 RepID=A0A4P1R776_LUPAN|nr:PREDICTED: uncharacterized protein LOC109358556 [Lupinus angustifolius]OIW03925.1 hypothetical protein TanjilG_30201 [Lupinus angustifolius]
MATSKSHHISTPNYRFLPILETEYSLSDSPSFDFDDSDLFNSPPSNDSHDFRKTLHSSRYSKSSSSPSVSTSLRPASLPVNVPDWSKILGREYRGNRKKDNLYDDDDDDDVSDDGGGGGGGGRVPPHEYLARTRMASLSVHEGVGRTLKGRDLSRVRNAIWAKTGFQD